MHVEARQTTSKLRSSRVAVRFQDLETLLLNFGFILARTTGSHHIYRFERGETIVNLIIPVHRNTVKPKYVRDVVETIDNLFPQPDEVEGNDE